MCEMEPWTQSRAQTTRGRTVTLDKGMPHELMLGLSSIPAVEDLYLETTASSHNKEPLSADQRPNSRAHRCSLSPSTSPGPHTSLTHGTLVKCKNCERYAANAYHHSFAAPLDQCKNRAWNANESMWIVAPTTAKNAKLEIQNSNFCSGDCLYSFLFSNDLLRSSEPDSELHFFKRVEVLKPADPSRTGVPVPISYL